MFVRNWMTAPAVVIPPVVPVGAALGFMEKRGIRRLPVVDDGKLVGIVTKSDLLAHFGGQGGQGGRKAGRTKNEDTVADVMTRGPQTVGPGDTLEAASQFMLKKKVSGLPVVDEDQVVGIITESDLFRALCEMLGLGEKGARLILTVRDGEDLLGAIRKRLGGLAVRSLVTVHDPKRNAWDVVLRVRGRLPAAAKT